MAADAALIQLLEEISTNALPSLETVYYDGWIVRLSNGYPRRASSVHPFYASTLPLDEKIDYCERLYWSRGITSIFKLTDLSADLVPLLTARGYVEDISVGVQITDELTPIDMPSGIEVELLPTVAPAWVADNQRLHESSDAQGATYAMILAKLPTPAAFVRILRDGQAVAIGLGVIEHGWMGLYSLVTDPNARRQGNASAVIGALYEWARNNGATRAYLQVHASNANALRLYEKLGYRPLYDYWYMQKNPPAKTR